MAFGIAPKDGSRVRLYSRPGKDLTDRFRLIVEALCNERSVLAVLCAVECAVTLI
jgi:ATP-dependent DNA ligase